MLIVEDDVSIRHVLREVLTDEGYDVEEATDGREALARLASWIPQVIILDLMMPGMDGWTFRARQRQEHRADNVPLIVLSASQRLAESQDLGAAALIPKPFDLDLLLGIIQQATGS